ncbi:hypothetical protein [Sinorhizobium sojae]|uniref:hypothetical protein n=1 Tax=Sinorhizobium sojae TaxID=716925 RepID=UPI0012F74B6B|nr:hypothetical protein [Sinorhizobium sojae]
MELEHRYRHPASQLHSSATGATMTWDALESTGTKALLPNRLLSGLVSGLALLLKPRYPRLDVGTVSDHMKRDMGFMDGRAPRKEGDVLD